VPCRWAGNSGAGVYTPVSLCSRAAYADILVTCPLFCPEACSGHGPYRGFADGFHAVYRFGADQAAAVLGAQGVPDLVEIGEALRDPFGLDFAILQEA
jgi:hypothetical protein